MNIKPMATFLLLLVLVNIDLLGEENLITERDHQKWSGTMSRGGKWSEREDKPGVLMLSLESEVAAHWIRHLDTIRQGKQYLLKAQVRAPIGNRYRIYLESTDRKIWINQGANWREGEGKWITYSYKFSFAQMPGKPYLVLQLESGKADFSELSITELKGKDGTGSVSLTPTDSIKLEKANWTLGEGAELLQGSALLMVPGKNGKTTKAVHLPVKVEPYKHYTISCDLEAQEKTSVAAPFFRIYPEWTSDMPARLIQWEDTIVLKQKKHVEFQVPARILNAKIVIEAKGEGKIRFSNIKIEPSEKEDNLSLAFNLPVGFRNTIFGSDTKSVFGAIQVQVGNAEKYVLTCFDQGGNKVGEKTFSPRSRPQFALPAPPRGNNYGYTLDALDSRGKILKTCKEKIEARPAENNEVYFNKDGVTMAGGEKFFPIASWTSIGRGSFSDEFRFFKEAGFNTIHLLADEFVLDTAEKEGFKIVAHYTPVNGTLADKIAQAKATFAKIADHPALLAVMAYDEPVLGGVTLGEMNDTYAALRSVLPHRPIYINEAPRNEVALLKPYYRHSCDVMGIDIYPVPEGHPHSALKDKGISAVGEYTKRAMKITGADKPVWMTLQSFAWNRCKNQKIDISKGEYPTYNQLRFMAYDAIVNGATGLFYWSLSIGHSNEFWADLRKVTRELHSLKNILTAETVMPAKIKADNSKIEILHKRFSGRDYFIVVNRSTVSERVTFAEVPAKTLNAVLESKKEVVNQGKLRVELPARGVKVYSEAAFPLPQDIFSLKTAVPFNCQEKQTEEVKALKNASWIWYPGKSRTKWHQSYFRKIIEMDNASSAKLFIAADDMFELWINGKNQGKGSGWSNIHKFNLELRKGKNLIAIKAADGGAAPCGLLLTVKIPNREDILSNESFLVRDTEEQEFFNNYSNEETDVWVKSEIVAPFNTSPWTGRMTLTK